MVPSLRNTKSPEILPDLGAWENLLRKGYPGGPAVDAQSLEYRDAEE
jgi:hypothetical protein